MQRTRNGSLEIQNTVVKINLVWGMEHKLMKISWKVEQKDRERENKKVKYTKEVSVGETRENWEDIINKRTQETFSALRP